MIQVFLSHSTVDSDFVNKLRAQLMAAGIAVWKAPESILPGERWVAAIQRGLTSSTHMLVVVSPAAVKSGWVRYEMEVAISRHVQGEMVIIPIDHQPEPAIPQFWRMHQAVTMRTPDGAGLKDLIARIRLEQPEAFEVAPGPGRAVGLEAAAPATSLTEAAGHSVYDQGRPLPPTEATEAEAEAARREAEEKEAARLRDEAQAKARRQREQREEADGHLRQAQEELRKGQWQEAARLLEAAKGMLPPTYPGIRELGEAIEAARLEEEARQRRDPVLDLLPPPFEWSAIPAGRVKIGRTDFAVAPFQLARYCVTNAQFDAFIRDGYADPRWWDYSPDALNWRKEHSKPQAKAFKGVDDHPRVNVSWYEAVAFCGWLSVQAGYEIHLPTEQEWQRAAGGDDGRTYAWGNEKPSKRLCNWHQEVGRTSPVDSYDLQAQRQPYGLFNMTGNVWEWCLTDAKSGAQDISQFAESRVLRGCSWASDFTNYLRVDFRYLRDPRLQNDLNGFRLASFQEYSNF